MNTLFLSTVYNSNLQLPNTNLVICSFKSKHKGPGPGTAKQGGGGGAGGTCPQYL